MMCVMAGCEAWLRGLGAVPVGGGRAAAHRHTEQSSLNAQAWLRCPKYLRAAAHGHAQPGPTTQGTPSPAQRRRARPARPNDAGHAKPGPTTQGTPSPAQRRRARQATQTKRRRGGQKSGRGLVSRRSEGPGIRRRIRGRRWSPRPRRNPCFPRSCAAEHRLMWPRRPGWRRARAS